MSKEKKTPKWGKEAFMKAWGMESKKKHADWASFAAAMASRAEKAGCEVPGELAVWNRIHTLKAALEKADPTIKCPAVPERPRKVSGEKPPTAAELAKGLGW
jgi:hypothetical protein